MPRTAVTCQRKLLLPKWMKDVVLTYQFNIFDMASCRDVELQVRNIVWNIRVTGKYSMDSGYGDSTEQCSNITVTGKCGYWVCSINRTLYVTLEPQVSVDTRYAASTGHCM